MNTQLKKGLLIFVGAFVVYWAFTKIKPIGKSSSKRGGKSNSSSAESISDNKKNALVILTAYKNAKDAGEPKSFLDEMNSEFISKYKLRVITDKGSGKLIATDLEGNKVL